MLVNTSQEELFNNVTLQESENTIQRMYIISVSTTLCTSIFFSRHIATLHNLTLCVFRHFNRRHCYSFSLCNHLLNYAFCNARYLYQGYSPIALHRQQDEHNMLCKTRYTFLWGVFISTCLTKKVCA